MIFLKFVNLIKILYKIFKSKVQENGKFTDDIQVQRSVRQGCPLSMFLYVIIISLTFYSQIFLEEIKSLQHADDTTINTRK